MLRVDHDCEINIKSEQIYYLPNRTRYQRYVALFRQMFMASLKNPRAHRYLRNHSAIINEKRQHLRKNVYIIHPFSIFRYLDKARRYIEMNSKQIAKRYILHGTFIVDLLSSFPTDIIFLFNWNNIIVAREFTSMLHILRLLSLRIYIINIAESYDIQRGYLSVLTFVPLSILSLHGLTCITWMIPIVQSSLTTIKLPNTDSWTVINELWQEDNQYRYWSCLMRSIAILTRSGFLSSEPKAPEDQYVSVIMQSLGTLVVCYVIAEAIRLFKADNSSKLKYQATVAQLKQYMRYKQLPNSVQERFLKYYEFRYQQHYFRESEILYTLSSQMRQEIVMHSCRKLVENVAFFNNLPILLLTRIVAQLKSEIFLTNDVIVRANQPGDCMYFISSGTVSIYTDSGKEVCHLEDGAHFGEIALVMPDEHRVATVIAVEMCELYRLERNDFMRTIYPYPILWERIKKIAIERHEKTMIIDAH
ncbi:hypothetical protein PV325_000850 [Microctonus aethiopoides]|nr:hypothetical protein PV325_000850 [Microctonus aethiopoides]KAK0094592.1 hypothetical protein PV326_010506 [Microctonus aethiopoides]